jgi:hypothetical protein
LIGQPINDGFEGDVLSFVPMPEGVAAEMKEKNLSVDSAPSLKPIEKYEFLPIKNPITRLGG